MFKLVIVIEAQDDMLRFEQDWPRFLAAAEELPDLVRETTSPVHSRIHGHLAVSMIHELYFENRDALETAMHSPQGELAGKLLQEITRGRVTLLLADHLEDELENIQSYKRIQEDLPPGNKA